MNDQFRVLDMMLRLQAGARLGKQELSKEYGVSPKTVQRDFARLAEFLESSADQFGRLLYDGKTKTRSLERKTRFHKQDILIIAKIILEARALNRDENKNLLDGLLELVPSHEAEEIRQIIASEWFNYAPVTDQQDRIAKIWQLSEAIRKERVLEVTYTSPYTGVTKSYAAFPVSLFFDNHYFYLVAYHLGHEDYFTLKIDRMEQIQESAAPKPNISYGQRFRDGDVRRYQVDAMQGREIQVEVTYDSDPTIVLDQFPDAKLLSQEGKEFKIRFTAQDTKGLERWIFGQGEHLQVQSPVSLVKRVQAHYQEMAKRYQ